MAKASIPLFSMVIKSAIQIEVRSITYNFLDLPEIIAMSEGINSTIGSTVGVLANNADWGQLGVAAFQGGAHASTGGIMSVMQGGNFWHGASSG